MKLNQYEIFLLIKKQVEESISEAVVEIAEPINETTYRFYVQYLDGRLVTVTVSLDQGQSVTE